MNLGKLLLLLMSILTTMAHSSDGGPAAPGQLLIDPGRVCRRTRKFATADSTNLINHGRALRGGPSRFRRKVSSLCKKSPELIRESQRGARLATSECQFQLRNSLWNCSAIPRTVRKILSKGFRETAAISSFVSAGVTYAITQACSSGQITDCPCDRTGRLHSGRTTSTEGSWEWGGCSGGDNIHIGYARSKDILDIKRRRNDIRTIMSLHNNEAGRLAVKAKMKLMCKCHGLSGSCQMRTCWQKVSSFGEVGEQLKIAFDGAVKVIPGNDGRSVIPAHPTVKPPDPEDLIYFDDSQDYCSTNPELGSLGTQGRECNASSRGVDGCDLLCCGRGYNTKIVKTVKNCRCRFEWCCEVKCDVCAVKKVIHTCR